MASVTLKKPDIALFTDVPGTRIILTRLVQQELVQNGAGAFALFEGSARPTGGRSVGTHKTLNLAAVFAKLEQETARDLVRLLEHAFHSTDGRLQIRTAGSNFVGLDPLAVVEVHSWRPAREPGGIIRVEFEATEVTFSLDVDSDSEYPTTSQHF